MKHTERHIRIRDLLLMSWVMRQMDSNDRKELDELSRDYRPRMRFAS